MERFPVIVVGSGPAGLATAQQLSKRGISHVVLERGDTCAHVWRNLYDSLTLHTGRHLSALPDCPFPKGTPLFPSRADFVAYLDQYAERFELPVRTGVEVTSATYVDDEWRLETSAGPFVCGVLVCAAGIVSTPVTPEIPGREGFGGSVSHAWSYRRPEPLRGRRVLVVGVGNTGGEIAPEIATVAERVDVAVRSGALAVPKKMFGLPIQYQGWLLAFFPRWVMRFFARCTARLGALVRGPSPLPPPATTSDNCPDVPLIGFSLVDALKSGAVGLRPGLDAFTATGVRFSDGTEAPYDEVIFATGYRATMGFLESGGVGRDDCGFGRRTDRVTSADRPSLFFVGHTYDSRGGLCNLAIDAKRVGKRVAALLPS